MAKIFITGATGQVGSHLVEYLVRKVKAGSFPGNNPLGVGNIRDIFCLIRPRKNKDSKASDAVNGSRKAPESVPVGIPSGRGKKFLERLGVKFVTGDLSNIKFLLEALNGIDYVFHLAANVYVYSNFEDMYKTNVEGTKNLLDAFVKSNAILFVYTSSVIVYDTSHKAFKICSSMEKSSNIFGSTVSEKIFDFMEDCPWGSLEKIEMSPMPLPKDLERSSFPNMPESTGISFLL